MVLLAVVVICVAFIFVLVMVMLVCMGVVLRPRGRAWVVLVFCSLHCIEIRGHRSHLGAGRTSHIDSSLSRKVNKIIFV